MKRHKTRTILLILLLVCSGITGIVVTTLTAPKPSPQTADTQPPAKTSSTPAPTAPTPEIYEGQVVAIGNEFSVRVPNGWRASVSTRPDFLAVRFAQPGQLESLIYDKTAAPAVDYDGIPAWSGLTEHLYIRLVTNQSQAFNPAAHAEVSSESFTFTDGTVGTKYLVTKHAAEAQKWGGLLKDSEWYGRVFVYKKDGKTIEAHLAYYPSTHIATNFYDNVVRSVHIGAHTE